MEFINNYAVSAHTLDGKYVNTWPSAAQAAKELGMKKASNIISCINGRRNKSGGYIWKQASLKVELLEGEEWKPVVGFEELYAVSNKGRVASLQYHGKPTFSIMSLSQIKGYPVVKIRNSKTNYAASLKVHRLVAEAFIPNPQLKPCIDHIDTNTYNNCVENLKWVTPLENQRNPLTLAKLHTNMVEMNKKKIGPMATANKYGNRVQYIVNGSKEIYRSAKQASKATGHTIQTILSWSRNNKNGWSLI